MILFIFLNIFLTEINLCYALSERDMLNPTILTNEGWGYLQKGYSQKFNKPEEYFEKSEKYFKKAEEYFEKALKIDKYHADAYAGLGQLIMVRNNLPSINFNFDKNSCRNAIKFFDIAISLDERTRALASKCDALICLEDFDAALLEADIVGKYHNCYAHSIKARAYKGRFLSKKDPSDKKMAIVEATDYMECNDSGINLLKDIMRTMKDFDSTEKYLKKRIESNPYSISRYNNYHQFLLLRIDEGNLKDTDISEAEKIIKECKANTNFNLGAMWEFYLHRANVLFKRKEYDKALSEYIEVIADNPNIGYVKERISFLCSQFKDDRCIKSWQKIIKTYLGRGDCLNANAEFKILYANHPTAFEPMKAAVSQCQETKVSTKESVAIPKDKDDELAKIKKLLEANPNLVLANDENSVRQLHVAAHSGRIDIAKLLIERGVDINAKIKDGKTPLHSAALGGQLEAARLLIKKGANINARDEYDFTPLHIAAFVGQLEIARLLIEKSADVNARDDSGKTPLDRAVSSGQLEFSRFLIDKGADINARDSNGMTPLHSAVSYGQIAIAKLLVEEGANVNTKDDDGATPLSLATIRKKDDMINLLKRHGGKD